MRVYLSQGASLLVKRGFQALNLPLEFLVILE